MLIIDRYLLRQFIRTFLICYVSLTGLYIVFDAFTNLEEFLRVSEKTGGLLALMGSHYGYRSIAFFDRTAGLLTLLAATFTISLIQRHNEMTALLAAGIPRIRIVLPVIGAARVVVVLSTANRELLMPRFRRELARKPHDLIGDVAEELTRQYDNQTDILIGGRSTYADRQRIDEPRFVLPSALCHYGRQLAAEDAYYRPPEENRPGGYLLDAVTRPKDLDSKPSLRLRDKPVIITPHDAPDWLEPDQCFVVSEVGFEELTTGRRFHRFSSTAQLISGLRNPSLGYGADVRMAIHTRMVNPLLDLNLLLLGLPLVVSRESRNVFLAIAACVGVVALFLLVVIGCQQLGASLVLEPALAAWVPLILFVPPAVWLAEGMWR